MALVNSQEVEFSTLLLNFCHKKQENEEAIFREYTPRPTSAVGPGEWCVPDIYPPKNRKLCCPRS